MISKCCIKKVKVFLETNGENVSRYVHRCTECGKEVTNWYTKGELERTKRKGFKRLILK